MKHTLTTYKEFKMQGPSKHNIKSGEIWRPHTGHLHQTSEHEIWACEQ